MKSYKQLMTYLDSRPAFNNPRDDDSVGMATISNALSSQFNATLSNDMYAAFARQIQARAGISLDQQALNAVHANFQ